MMANSIGDVLNFHGDALKLRAERQRMLASNIANADTPNYKAVDFNFRAALANLTSASADGSSASAAVAQSASSTGALRTDLRHFGAERSTLDLAGVTVEYRTPSQLSGDGNTVEMDTERANFADNAIRYEASVRFINAQIKTMTMAIQGQ